MELVRYSDDSDLAATRMIWPAQGFNQRRAIFRWIPFHQNQLGVELMSPTLFDEAVDKVLHPVFQTVTMIVISGSGDDAEMDFARGIFSLQVHPTMKGPLILGPPYRNPACPGFLAPQLVVSHNYTPLFPSATRKLEHCHSDRRVTHSGNLREGRPCP